ncbi:MAG: peptide ABC transporter permease, partial [Acinetobacter sp.]
MTTQASKIESSIQHPAIAKSFEFPAWLPWFLTRIVSGILVIFVI